MRSSLVGLLAAVVFVAAVSAQGEKVAWQKVTLKATGATAEFPGKATEKNRPNGSQFLLQAEGGKGIYLVDVASLPKEIDVTDKAAVKKLMSAAESSMLKGLKARVVSDKDITLDKSPGKAFVLDSTTIGVVHVRVFVTPTAFYQVLVGGPKELAESKASQKFLGSLKLKKAAGAP